MVIDKALTVITAASFVSGTVYAQPAAGLAAAVAPHPLRDAVARQHQPLRPASSARAAAGRHNSTATKVTAGVALGLAGFLAGSLTAFYIRYVANSPGDGRAAVYTGGMIGAGAGAALGVWLASR
jgi:hypothetical protein